MKKIKLKRTLRRGIIISLVFLLLGSAGTSIWWFLQPGEIVEEVPALAYGQRAAVDYRVYFDPNEFFPEESAGPGRAYLVPITDYVNTFFTYRFAGDERAEITEIKGDYEVTAALTAYVVREKPGSEEKEQVKVWGKTEVLLPTTAFVGGGRGIEVKQQVPIDFPRYVDFAEQVRKELKFSPDIVELSVIYGVNIEAVTSRGDIAEEMAVVMVIPVRGNAFTVEGRLADSKEGVIMTERTVPAADVLKNRQTFAIITGLLLLPLFLVIFRTTEAVQAPWERELHAIMKKHGERVAASRGRVPLASRENMLTMHSFADLVKVADEVGQPILYEVDEGRRHSFYVPAEPLVYLFTLEEESEGAAVEKDESLKQ